MYLLPLALLLFIVFWFIYRKQWQNLVRPIKYHVEHSGAPQYVAGSTSGSPLSELGSHCGFKVVPEKAAACCNALFATVTSLGSGRLYDFAVFLCDREDKPLMKETGKRKVQFSPYCIEEWSHCGSIALHSRLFFLQRNLAVLETEWEAPVSQGKEKRGEKIEVKPCFRLMPVSGRDIENPYPHFNGFSFTKKNGEGLLLSVYHRLPGLKLFAYFLPGNGECTTRKSLTGETLTLEPGRKKSWSVLISFAADRPDQVALRAQRARRNLEGLKKAAEKRWARFHETLPVPYEQNNHGANDLFKLSAWALQNSLYYPRGKMRRWGSVPAKVYFPFIWGWDTPQHVIGLSEWNPQRAGEVLLTQLDGNMFAPEKARFKLKIKRITVFSGTQRNQIPSKIDDSLRGVLNFYSQPPLQSWAALKVYERVNDNLEKEKFLEEVLPPLRANLHWWEENRQLKNNFFSYINGLESGLDDSPRFYPPSFLPSFVIGLVPRFFSAVDLNCWIFQSYINVSYLCKQAGLDREAAHYLERGFGLKQKIDDELWSDEHEAWLDRRNGKYIEVITPSIWWPAFVGASFSLERIRAVIERYMLNPEKFWGAYGIPSVAFDDKAYNSRKDGYYWRGQIWMINNYAALEALFRFGYHREAQVLHDRVVETLAKSEGLFETYNAQTGAVGWSSRGPGDPAVMQFGMSSAWATQILFCRYQHFSFIFPHTMEMTGHIQWAGTFDQAPVMSPPSVEPAPHEAVLRVEMRGKHAYDVPKLNLKSRDGKPLLRSALLALRFDDPTGRLDRSDKIVFSWRGEDYHVEGGKEYLLKPTDLKKKMSSA